MDTLGRFLKTQLESEITVVVTDNYSKIRAISTWKEFYQTWQTYFSSTEFFFFGIPSYLFTDNWAQFLRKFFATVGNYLCVNHKTMTTRHLQTKGKAKLPNCTILTHIQHYFGALHQELGMYFIPLTWANYMQMYYRINVSPDSIVLSQLL